MRQTDQYDPRRQCHAGTRKAGLRRRPGQGGEAALQQGAQRSRPGADHHEQESRGAPLGCELRVVERAVDERGPVVQDDDRRSRRDGHGKRGRQRNPSVGGEDDEDHDSDQQRRRARTRCGQVGRGGERRHRRGGKTTPRA